MNFFEKAQARADALDLLGLEGHPSMAEMKAAYRALVFARHPDRGGGSDADMRRVKEAYRLLLSDEGYAEPDPDRQATPPVKAEDRPAPEPKQAVGPRPVRTAMTSRIRQLDDAASEECRKFLDALDCVVEPDPEEATLRASIMSAIQSADAPYVPPKDHLPYAVRQSGRRISYMIGDTIAEGVNRVAVPTGVFTDNRKVSPAVVRFTAAASGIGTHVVPASVLAASFPGAKSVRLHFGMVGWPPPSC